MENPCASIAVDTSFDYKAREAFYKCRVEQLEAENKRLKQALENFVSNSYEQDVGGGDIVVATCECREQAVRLLNEIGVGCA